MFLCACIGTRTAFDSRKTTRHSGTTLAPQPRIASHVWISNPALPSCKTWTVKCGDGTICTHESVRDPPHLRPRQKHACDVHRAAASAGAVAACAPIRVRGSEGDGERAMNAPVEPNARAIREDLSQSEHRPSDVCTYSFDIQCCL